MSKKTEEVVLTKGYQDVAAAMAATINAVSTTVRENITRLVKAARKTYGGEPIPKHDLDAIADAVQDRCKWTAKRADVYRSEVRTIVNAYDSLDVAVDKYVKATGSIGYHTTVRLARLLRNHTPAQAVAMIVAGAQKASAPKSPKVAIESAVKQLAKVNARNGTAPAKFLADLAKLCARHGIAFGE